VGKERALEGAREEQKRKPACVGEEKRACLALGEEKERPHATRLQSAPAGRIAPAAHPCVRAFSSAPLLCACLFSSAMRPPLLCYALSPAAVHPPFLHDVKYSRLVEIQIAAFQVLLCASVLNGSC
jgi:hypothetical protein